MEGRANCSKWIAETDRRYAFVSPRAVHSPANTILFFRLPTPSASGSSNTKLHVLARLQIGRFHPAAPLGRRVFAASLRAYVCSQFLGRSPRRYRSPVELGQLQNSLHESALR